MCPWSVPGDGEACDACQHPIGSTCDIDECASGGIHAQAICDGTKWSVTQVPCGTVACCSDDAQCPGMICVSTLCKPKGAEPCWRDDQCDASQLCSGVSICPCNADCAYGDSPGTCVPNDMGCCKNDGDCSGSAGQCVAGHCLTPAPVGTCWADRDCFGATCEGEQVCACGTSCLVPDTPGTCSR